MRTGLVITILIIAALIGLATALLYTCEDDWCFWFEWQKVRATNDFATCVARGFPVTESHPRQCRAGDKTFTESVAPPQNERAQIPDLIVLDRPLQNEVVSSPLVLEGEARGNWYFEASFPIRIFDADNRELGVIPAQAQGEWMTTDFVPFRAVLYFDPPTTETGTLVLEKDNPSGLPEHANELRVPVRFAPRAAISDPITVKAFFNNSALDPEFSCNRVFPVDRRIERTTAVARAALEELLGGPTGTEVQAGYFTSINPGVMIQSLTIANGVARVDFSNELERAVGGSCRVSAIRAQITETLKQFPTVSSVVLSIDGRTEDILQP
ncbi:hypothetical protein C4552_03645 [Candidatus Parcubacteria bacterium]|nr:MAG: hypothetical protein C4552_03645 [Candidatus Parcubacteria bacterium]